MGNASATRRRRWSSGEPARPAAVVERLTTRGLPVRVGSRSGTPPFDWEARSTWAPALEGVGAVYVSYYLDAPRRRSRRSARSPTAVRSGVPRLVLLSGRGEPEAERVEQAVRDSPSRRSCARPGSRRTSRTAGASSC